MYTDQAPFTSESSSKLFWINFDVRGQQGMSFLTGGSVIMDYGLIFWPEAMV